MEHQLTRSKLGSWSWQEIQAVYWTYGQRIKEYARIKKSLGLAEIRLDIKNSDLQNIFVGRFTSDIKQIDLQIAALDREIARRNQLIGVMG